MPSSREPHRTDHSLLSQWPAPGGPDLRLAHNALIDIQTLRLREYEWNQFLGGRHCASEQNEGDDNARHSTPQALTPYRA